MLRLPVLCWVGTGRAGILLLFLILLFRRSVKSDSFWTHGLQNARHPCPSPTTGVCSNSYHLSQWCHATISSSVVPFFSCLQSFPGSWSFQTSQLFWWPRCWTFSFSISPSNEYSGLISFRMDWFDLLAAQRTLKRLFLNRSSKASILQGSAFFTVQLLYPHMTTGKTTALTKRTFGAK